MWPWKEECSALAMFGRGDGERCGEVQASGEGGMLLVDLRRPTLVKR